MKIFAQEIADGLSETIAAKASISYASLAEPSHTDNTSLKNIKALAGLSDKDLYYTQSILVTTSWNKNDDVFDKSEVWAARQTPIHKPTNLEHDEKNIVGHITANWPITDDGILIDSATPIENLPNKYHILTGSVIYTGFTDPELRSRSMQLIEEIENGTKYVSMECFFDGFDYGLTNKSTGEFKVLSRNEETAFLTKHLRAYGGTGEHQDHKLGRVLRNITFSGKGFVNKPANPESIIFTKNYLYREDKDFESDNSLEKNGAFQNKGVFSIQANLKETDMNLETQVAEISEKLEAMSKCEESMAEAKTLAASLEEKTSTLEATVKAQETSLLEAQKALELAALEKEEAAKKTEEEMKKKEEEMMKMKAELDAATEVIAAYKGKEAEMMKKEKKMKRMATLIEAGLDNELATTTVDKFESLDDEAFASMTEVFAAVMPPKKKSEDMKSEEKKNAKSSDEVSEILEQAEPENSIDLSVGNELADSEVDNTRAALVDFVYNRLGKKLNKGE